MEKKEYVECITNMALQAEARELELIYHFMKALLG